MASLPKNVFFLEAMTSEGAGGGMTAWLTRNYIRQMPAKALIVYHEEASLQDHLSLYGRSCFLVLLELKRKIQEIIMYTLLTLRSNNE